MRKTEEVRWLLNFYLGPSPMYDGRRVYLYNGKRHDACDEGVLKDLCMRVLKHHVLMGLLKWDKKTLRNFRPRIFPRLVPTI